MAENGNGFLLREIEECPPSLFLIPRCPYKTGMKPCILRVGQMTVKNGGISAQINTVNQMEHNFKY